MSFVERTFIYVGLVLALCLAVAASNLGTKAHASAPAASADSVGVVNVVALAQQLLETEAYSEVRNARAGELTTQLEGLNGQLQQIAQRLQLTGQNDPNFQQSVNEYRQLQSQLQQASAEGRVEMEMLGSKQLVETYRIIRQASIDVAKREHVGVVFASHMEAPDDKDRSLNDAEHEIFARPVLGGEAVRDLTDLVRTELGLPEPTPEAAGGADATGADAPASDAPAQPK
ncbi:MAG: OmpH family outer membrane protein [Phycisphaerales bacterium]|jgi:TolA-binding protein|nr:OmpH family outer membrane protein [Phycisphaerales bacterium]